MTLRDAQNTSPSALPLIPSRPLSRIRTCLVRKAPATTPAGTEPQTPAPLTSPDRGTLRHPMAPTKLGLEEDALDYGGVAAGGPVAVWALAVNDEGHLACQREGFHVGTAIAKVCQLRECKRGRERQPIELSIQSCGCESECIWHAKTPFPSGPMNTCARAQTAVNNRFPPHQADKLAHKHARPE